MESDPEDGACRGPARATRLIDAFGRLPFHEVPASFARIIVGLFPVWFDFGADKFAVLAWERGSHLIVSGSKYGFAIISTSDSRCMACIYLGETYELARMDMHYQPSAKQTERARTVILMALVKLFPGIDHLPDDLAGLVPAGRVF